MIENIKQELRETVQGQQGIIFRFYKEDDQFIHTLCEGEFLYRIGLTPEQVIGNEFHKFFPKETSDFILSYYQRAWAGEEVVYVVPNLNGYTLLTALRPIRQNGEVVSVIGSCMDVTQLKREEDLQIKSEKLAVVGQLAAGIAHEIRNPLTTIKGFVQLLLCSKLEKKNQVFMELILTEINQLEGITNEFIAVVNPQVKQFQPKSIKNIIQKATNFLKPQALINDVKFLTELDLVLPIIHCEEDLFKQVFIHIIKNAIEAMPNGGEIHINGRIEQDYLVIRIADQGCGIPPDRLVRLGEPFFSLKEKGIGLGLMVCNKIMERHQGWIYIQSETGKGTTVEVYIPTFLNLS